MERISQMIRTHPDMQASNVVNDLGEIMSLLAECEAVCRLCADACLHEAEVESLRACIEYNLVCAQACNSALTALASSAAHPGASLLVALEACMMACATCAAECEQHAEHHEHCRICAQVCRECEDRCATLVNRLSAGIAIDIRRAEKQDQIR
jgi:hypothetical protein